MTKKKHPNEEPRDNESCEKLRDELFQYRVEIQSYKRSMNTLWACVSVVVAILGFFGYNRVESLLEKVEESANERLSKTDSILTKIDTQFLDSITTAVAEKTEEYENAIAALEKGMRVNKELYKKLISGMPYNKRVDDAFHSYVERDAVNLFDVIFYDDKYVSDKTGECYVVMGDEYKKEKNDLLLVEVKPNNRHVIVYYQAFEVQNNYNRLHYSFSQFEKYKEYTLIVVLIRKQGKDYLGYTVKKPVVIK